MPEQKATLTNKTHERLRLPTLGTSLDAGATMEVEDDVARQFAGHPHIAARLADGTEPKPEPDRGPKKYDLSWMLEGDGLSEAPQTAQDVAADEKSSNASKDDDKTKETD